MDKTELLFQMMEQPDKYTHEQWQDILADEECRELYMLMSKTKSAFDVQREVSDEEIDAEWRRLQQQTTAEETTSDIRSRHRWLNIAAMFVGLLVLSGIAYAAVRIISSNKEESNTQTQETTIVNHGQESQQAGQEVLKDSLMIQPIVFEDKELSSILGDIAPYYHYEVVYQNKAAKSIRIYFTWDMAASIEDVVETFNKFDRIHITKENNKLIVK